jgi:NTE family protein
LILELSERGIPIDLVAGSSSGALMGAYYCAAGIEGIARIIARGPEFARGMLLMTVSSAAAQYIVDADLDSARLEDLEVPLLPVATNLRQLRPEVITRGTVGFGVRASVSAPGLFAPTLTVDAIYVDGAVTDNVPVALVENMGADLVIATNPLPAAVGPRPRSQGQGSVWDGLRALNPWRRIRDFSVSLALMLHLAGEHEMTDRRVIYSADPAAAPLLTTFDYAAARRVVDHVRHRDVRFRQAVDASVQAFRALASPRRWQEAAHGSGRHAVAVHA